MSWFDFEDDPLLSFAMSPGFVVVFERELIDMFICALCCELGNFAADLNVTIGGSGVLNDKRHFGVGFHVSVFCAAFVRVDENILVICVEPDRRNLRRAVGHDGCEKEVSLGLVLEQVEIFCWEVFHGCDFQIECINCG